MRLHLGCGWRNFGGDWIHVDGGDYEHLDHNDITKLPYEDETVDLIYASHVLEYFDREEAVDILTEWTRVLKKGGVLRIAQISGQVAELGVASFISFLAVLSINLGLINLFPIPLLDGGHLAFYAVEAIRGKPLGPKIQEYGFRVGLGLVGALFLFVTWNDLVYLKFFEAIANILM